MSVRILSVTAVVAATLVGCAPPDDTITEIEKGVNGVKVETRNDREYYFRSGIDLVCETGEILWNCASQRDLLVERG